jgi:hypothetical protein
MGLASRNSFFLNHFRPGGRLEYHQPVNPICAMCKARRQAGRQAFVRLDELLDARVSFLPVNWMSVVLVTCR